MKVLKFGGSSLATPERIRAVMDILRPRLEAGERLAVVVSAFGGVTDSLVQMGRLAEAGDRSYEQIAHSFSQRHLDTARELLDETHLDIVRPQLEKNHDILRNLLYGVFLVREASPRTMDYILSFGERNSAFIIAHALQQLGIPAAYLDARSCIKTDASFGAAMVNAGTTYANLRDVFSQCVDLQIVTGFIASTQRGLTTTLGRGGSDYTAALLGAALDAEAIEIWTDVDGVLTADPRRVRNAFTLPSLSYAEAMELSHFGAKVIYPPTIQPAMARNIPLYIRNTFNPDFAGTCIAQHNNGHEHAVTGISSINAIALITLQGSGLVGVPGTAARLFGALARAGINIILITQGSSEQSITFAVRPEQALAAGEVAETEFRTERAQGLVEAVRIEEELAAVAIVGEQMRYRPGIAGRLFEALGKNGINVVAIAQGSSELNISVVVRQQDETKALNAVHEAFFLSDVKIVHLFMVGVGLIGSTLIRQIRRQSNYLREKQSLEVRIVGLANSRKMLFNAEGIALDRWRETLDELGSPMEIGAYIRRMNELNLSNSIFLDNTANKHITEHYHQILDASISISTPNKIAASGPYTQFKALKDHAERRGVQFLYETNVGAGLPVISTLQDLIGAGDEILQIQGVLSGSLSYLFNNLQDGQTFSRVVQNAAELGLTEPDPREDLSGDDVLRKLVILARETGLPLEAADVAVEPLLPPALFGAPDVDAFYRLLKAEDEAWKQRVEAAGRKHTRLRFIAALDRKARKAHIGLREVKADSPFFALEGSDNMIVFTTARYRDRPLVVRGPGAGADVTAAGVFAEVLKIGNYLSS